MVITVACSLLDYSLDLHTLICPSWFPVLNSCPVTAAWPCVAPISSLHLCKTCLFLARLILIALTVCFIVLLVTSRFGVMEPKSLLRKRRCYSWQDSIMVEDVDTNACRHIFGSRLRRHLEQRGQDKGDKLTSMLFILWRFQTIYRGSGVQICRENNFPMNRSFFLSSTLWTISMHIFHFPLLIWAYFFLKEQQPKKYARFSSLAQNWSRLFSGHTCTYLIYSTYDTVS